LIHLGRKDFQVKVRGHRVEIAEIEAALLALKTVKETVAIAREDGAEGQTLVAYIVPAQQPGPTVTALRQALTEVLPHYMIPSAFVSLATLPVLPTGKINRQALPVPETTRPHLANSFVAPRTLIEETLAGLWSKALKVDPVGVTDNFLELGGHSLLATQIISRLRQHFDIELSLPSFFENPTVTGLAQLVEQLQTHQPTTPPITRVARTSQRLK
jgi:acyl carrier protein